MALQAVKLYAEYKTESKPKVTPLSTTVVIASSLSHSISLQSVVHRKKTHDAARCIRGRAVGGADRPHMLRGEQICNPGLLKSASASLSTIIRQCQTRRCASSEVLKACLVPSENIWQ
jgi:hypothetical protein